MKSQKDIAKDLVNSFGSRTGAGAFTGINRADVVKGFNDRIDEPFKINQGNVSICSTANVVYLMALGKPVEYAQFVIDLYEKGYAKYISWDVKPGTDLKSYVLTSADHIAPVDWIPMASIRDSENWFFDFSERTGNGGADPGEISNWLKKAGFTLIVNERNKMYNKDEANLRLANTYYGLNYHVMLGVNASAVGNSSDPNFSNHVITLTSGITFGTAFDGKKEVQMEFYTWGGKRKLRLALDDFLKNYYGFIACKF